VMGRPPDHRWALLVVAGFCAPPVARAQTASDGSEDPLAIRVPERLTAGGANQLMGRIARVGPETLYFVSDEAGTTELFVQAPVDRGAPERLFDGSGDVAWPEVSPDGRYLAYVSYVRDATGDACVRSVADGSERCLTGDDSAELQVVWLDDRHVAVLSRPRLHGGFELRSFRATGDGRARPGPPMLGESAVGVAASPDGRWIAYVPLEARREDVGVTFVNRTAGRIRLARLGDDGIANRPRDVTPDLPGVTGYPAFGPEGRHLYFAQYLNDTNRDGTIDGNDNGVVFRLPFDPDADGDPVPGDATPTQLTSARWNCHYPSPTSGRLVLTCSHGGSLDVYVLPLDGAVPEDMDVSRLRGERESARDLWTKLLLSGRLLAVVGDRFARLETLESMVALHLSLREYESASFYAARLATLAGEDTAPGRLGRLLGLLADHRRADVLLARGQPSRRYLGNAAVRLGRVEEIAGDVDDPNVTALGTLVRGEIRSDMGDKGGALEDLAAVDLDAVTDPTVLDLVAERGVADLGRLGAGDALRELLTRLALHPAYDPRGRLRHARALVLEIGRGQSEAGRRRALDAWRRRAPEGTELAVLLDAERALARLGEVDENEVREEVFALYRAADGPALRRAVALSAVQAASRRGNEFIQYQFVTTWASGVRPDDPERKYAVDLYETVVLERAYGELSDGELSEAAAYFFRAGRNAGALEAHAGFIETRIRNGETADELRSFYDERFADDPDDPTYLFAQAYLLVRALPTMGDAPPAAVVDRARDAGDLLARVAAARPREVAVHHLWAAALHHAARRSGRRSLAVAANRQYLLAIDLARDRPRAEAALRQGVGVLQASLGNHRRAVEHFDVRARWPFVRPAGELAFHLARARSLFHARQPAAARTAAERAAAVLDAHPELARFAPVVADRLAFHTLQSGDAGAALVRYQVLADRLGDGATPANRLRAHLGVAAAALGTGDHEVALDALARAGPLVDRLPVPENAGGDEAAEGTDGDAEPEQGDDADPSPAASASLLHDYTYSPDRYRALVAGLEASAQRGRGDLAGERDALERRLDLLRGIAKRSGAYEDLGSLARLHHRMADNAVRRGDVAGARQHLEAGLDVHDAYAEATGTPVDAVRMALVRAYAELVLYRGVARDALARDVEAELDAAYDFITRFRSPRWARDRFVLSLYLTLLRTRAGAA